MAELVTTDIGGLPLLHEHDAASRVGTCLASWEGKHGELRIAAEVEDPKTQEDIRNGKLRGLSLGTDLITKGGGDVLYRAQSELSVCVEGRRQSTWIDSINGETVRRVAMASKSAPSPANKSARMITPVLETKSSNHRAQCEMADTDAHSSAPASAEPSPELVESQAARIKELESRLASETAKASVYEETTRAKVEGFQDSAKWYYQDWLPEGETAEVKSELASLGTWANEYTAKANVMAQLPLARSCEVATTKIKRLREQASAGIKASEKLAETYKELEALKEEDSKKSARITELTDGMKEQQVAAEKLQAELSKAGLVAAKFDFSKLASREKVEGDGDSPMEPASAAKDAVQAVTAQASKLMGSQSANPFDSDLTAMIAKRGQGGLRMGTSATGHLFLGATDGSGDLAAALRAR